MINMSANPTIITFVVTFHLFLVTPSHPEEVGHIHKHYLLHGGFHTLVYTLADSLM